MVISRYLASIAIVIPAVLGAEPALAQNWPERPIHIVTSSPGGGADLSARILAQGLPELLGQPIVVENYSSTGAIEQAAKAKPDGYTVTLAGGSFWSRPLVNEMSYDPFRDFVPVSIVAVLPLVFVVHPSLPVNTVEDLIALAKEKPGELNYGSSEAGGGTHLMGEWFKGMTDTDIVGIPFSDDASLRQSLLSGEIQIAWENAAEMAPLISEGQLRAIAVTGKQRSALLPDVPTVQETVPGYSWAGYRAMFAPAGTPKDIVDRLSQAIARYLETDEAKKRFLAQGADPWGSTPEELEEAMNEEVDRLKIQLEEHGLLLEKWK